MITYRNALKLLSPGDVVYSLDESGGIMPTAVLEVCNGWLETNDGILDFDDHRHIWWLTEKEAINQERRKNGY